MDLIVQCVTKCGAAATADGYVTDLLGSDQGGSRAGGESGHLAQAQSPLSLLERSSHTGDWRAPSGQDYWFGIYGLGFSIR